MRITSNMMATQLMQDLSNITEKMNKLQHNIATTKKINKPSDNPSGAGKSMMLSTSLVENSQYTYNTDYAISWADSAETAFNSLDSVMQRARELAVSAANGPKAEEDREAIAQEVDQLRKQIIDLGNASIGDRYVFGGAKTSDPPFKDANPSNATYLNVETPTDAEIGYNGDKTSLMVQVSPGVEIEMNVPGGQPFASCIAALTNLRNATREQDDTKLQNALGEVDTAMKVASTERSNLGARCNRFEMVQERLADLELNYTSLLSKNEDTDMGTETMYLKIAQSIQRATLSIGSQTIQPSLVDFLK